MNPKITISMTKHWLPWYFIPLHSTHKYSRDIRRLLGNLNPKNEVECKVKVHTVSLQIKVCGFVNNGYR